MGSCVRALGIVGLLCFALCVVGASQVQFVEQWRTSMPPVVVDEPRSDIKDSDVTLVSRNYYSKSTGSRLLVAAFDKRNGDCLWVRTDESRPGPTRSVIGHAVADGKMWIVFNHGYLPLSSGYPAVVVDLFSGEELKTLPEFSGDLKVEYSAETVVTEDTIGILEMANSDRPTFFNRLGIRARLQLYDVKTLEYVGSMPINSTIPEHLRGRMAEFPEGAFTIGGYALAVRDNILQAMEFYHPYVFAPRLYDVWHRGQPHMVFDLGENYYLTLWQYYDPDYRYGGVDHHGEVVSVHRWIPGQTLTSVWHADGRFGIRSLGGVWTDGRFWTYAEGGKMVFFNRTGGRVFTLTGYSIGATGRESYVHRETKELMISQRDGDGTARYYLLSMRGQTRRVMLPNQHLNPHTHEDGLLLLDHVGEDEVELVFGHLR